MERFSFKSEKVTVSLNFLCDIQNCPNKITVVQQCNRARIVQHLIQFVWKANKEGMVIPTTIKIKLTGDGTRIRS